MTFTLVSGDDWEALYIDGKEVYQHHRVTARDVLEYGKLKHTTFEVDQNWLEDQMEFPDNLDDIPDNVKVTYG